MKYFTIKPPEHLAAYVRYFWVLEGEASFTKPYIHRSMADGCAELIFHYTGIFDELLDESSNERSFSSGLAGQSQQFRRFLIKQNFGIFGVYLYPFRRLPLIFSERVVAFAEQEVYLSERVPYSSVRVLCFTVV